MIRPDERDRREQRNLPEFELLPFSASFSANILTISWGDAYVWVFNSEFRGFVDDLHLNSFLGRHSIGRNKHRKSCDFIRFLSIANIYCLLWSLNGIPLLKFITSFKWITIGLFIWNWMKEQRRMGGSTSYSRMFCGIDFEPTYSSKWPSLLLTRLAWTLVAKSLVTMVRALLRH